MIQCYYTKETLDKVTKAGRRRLVFESFFWGSLMVLNFVLAIRMDPDGVSVGVPSLLGLYALFAGILYYIHRLMLRVERMTLQLADDEITLDEKEIRLIKTDGTQITFPRYRLSIQRNFYANGMIFRIWSPQIASSPEIVLTSNMENAKELVEAIEPGLWDRIDPF